MFSLIKVIIIIRFFFRFVSSFKPAVNNSRGHRLRYYNSAEAQHIAFSFENNQAIMNFLIQLDRNVNQYFLLNIIHLTGLHLHENTNAYIYGDYYDNHIDHMKVN